MNKPASVAIKEFSENIETCIYESGLPAVIIEMVMKDFYLQIRELAEKQTADDEKEYRKETEAMNSGE